MSQKKIRNVYTRWILHLRSIINNHSKETLCKEIKLHWRLPCVYLYTLSRFWIDINGGLGWILDVVLITLTHDLELQAITALPLIFTIHKSPQHPQGLSSLQCLHQPFLATTSNNGDSPAPRAQVLSSQAPVRNWLTSNISLAYNVSARTT
jgi:hypothetical protein